MISDDMPLIQTLAVLISGLGATNWGLQEVLNMNILVELGLSGDSLTAAYLVIAIAGLVVLVDMVDTTSKSGVGETSPLQEG